MKEDHTLCSGKTSELCICGSSKNLGIFTGINGKKYKLCPTCRELDLLLQEAFLKIDRV